jgi:hypothetical protein
LKKKDRRRKSVESKNKSKIKSEKMDYSYLNQAGFDPAMSAAVAAADNSFYGDLVNSLNLFQLKKVYFLFRKKYVTLKSIQQQN